jgi:SOS regulatory protein LexA
METAHVSKIRRFYKTHRRMPSYTEIMKLLRYRSKNAAFRLVNKLVSLNLVERDAAGRIIPSSRFLGTIPLFASPVEAGWPSPAEEELVDTITLDEYLIPNKEATVSAPVKGDSMKDAGIVEGDIVLIERGRPYGNGDIVVVSIDGGYTLKYYRKRGTEFYFEPANDKYKPIYPKVGQEIKIIGVVVGSFRKYR